MIRFREVGRAGPIIAIAIGLVFLAGAVAFAAVEIASRSGTALAPGRVVARQSEPRQSFPIFAFTPANGPELRVVSRVASDRDCCSEGALVTVRYRRDAPRDARIDSFKQSWMAPLGLGVFATFRLLSGVVMMRVDRRDAAARSERQHG